MPSRPGTSRPADHLRLVGGMDPAPAAAGPLRSVTSLRPAVATTVARSFGDWAWHGLGVGAATASAGFATYALVFSTGEVVPSGNFNIFARSERPYQVAAVRHGAAPDAPATARKPTETAADGAVDFTPTGSLAASAEGAQGDGRASPAARGRAAGESRPLPNFTLRDVFDGKALVESRSSLSVVKPGSVLDGAGEVLAIEKRGDRWVVVTASGVIAGQRR